MRSLNSARFLALSKKFLLRLASAYPIIGLIFLTTSTHILSAKPENKYGILPDFTLTDSENALFQKNDLHGKVWLAHTFFTSCPSVCPTIITDIKNLISQMPEKYRPSVISITVDPQTDSVQRLTEYRNKRGLQDYSWKLLTGNPNAITSLIEDGLHLPGIEGSPDAHSPRIVLIDKESQIRGYYLATDTLDLSRLKKDLMRLLEVTS